MACLAIDRVTPRGAAAYHASRAGLAARIPSPYGSGFPAAGVMFVYGSQAAAAGRDTWSRERKEGGRISRPLKPEA